MKFSLDYCEHRASHAGLGASDSLIIPNGRIMDKNCLRPVCSSLGHNPPNVAQRTKSIGVLTIRALDRSLRLGCAFGCFVQSL